MIDLYNIGNQTVLVAPSNRPTREAYFAAVPPPKPVLCLITHGDDECIVLASSMAEVDRVARDRRLMLGLSGPVGVQTIQMVKR